MERNTKAVCVCHTGKQRKNNEDNFYFNGSFLEPVHDKTDGILEIDQDVNQSQLFAVFDGMGGGDYGELASHGAAQALDVAFHTHVIDEKDLEDSLRKLCLYLNQKVYDVEIAVGSRYMGTTMVSLYYDTKHVWIFNVGDSRCYRFRSDTLEQLSLDHSEFSIFQRLGLQFAKPFLTQVLGMNPKDDRIHPFIREEAFDPEDIYILCSDGLSDMVEDGEILSVMKEASSLKEACEKLLERALDNGGMDNVTILLWQGKNE